MHTGGAAAGGVAVSIQQRWRVPGRRQRDQPQVVGANLRYRRAAALSVHTSTAPGEDRFSVIIWQKEQTDGFSNAASLCDVASHVGNFT